MAALTTHFPSGWPIGDIPSLEDGSLELGAVEYPAGIWLSRVLLSHADDGSREFAWRLCTTFADDSDLDAIEVWLTLAQMEKLVATYHRMDSLT